MKSLLLTTLILTATTAVAGQKEFIDMCKRQDLPEATKITVDTLVKVASGPFSHDRVTCEEAAAILDKHTSLALHGSTFEYLEVADLTPIATLENLEELFITSQERVKDLSPLKANTRLRKLDIALIPASDLLLDQLDNVPNVQVLAMTASPVTPIWNLTSLRSLVELQLMLSPSEGQPSRIDLAPLRGFMLQTLGLYGSSEVNVQGLETLQGLRSLSVRNVPLKGRTLAKLNLTSLLIDRSKLSHVEELKALTHLESLSIENSGLNSIEFVRELTGLKTLVLRSNQIEDIRPIAGLLKLEELNLAGNRIHEDFSLNNLFRLKKLNMDSNILSYSLNIASLVNLEELSAAYNHLLVLTMKQGQTFSRLKEIKLQGNSIRSVRDFTAVSFPNLETLDLGTNRIFNVDSLGELTNLQYLTIDDNRITDISKLMTLKKIKRLSARSNLLVNPACPVTTTGVCDFLHQGI